MSPNLSFQCSLTKASTSRTLDTSLAHPAYQWPLPVALSRVFPGWTQDDSYRTRRSGRTERGVRAYSPAWSELPTRNWVSGVEWDKRGHNSGMTPVNRKAGTGERTRELPGETPGIFIVLSGFAATDLSVRFRDACQGAEPMEKRQRRGLLVSLLSSLLASTRKFPPHL